MDQEPESRDFQWRDIGAAFALLSRIPVPADHRAAAARGAASVWAFPLVGAAIGGLAGLAGAIFLALNLPAAMAAALTLGVLVLLCGAMHEDGLADCADGLGGGQTAERRLQIMRDSRIGAYGAVALAIALLARWAGIDALSGNGLFWAMLASGAVSRLPMVLAIHAMPAARSDGMSAGFGAPSAVPVAAAVGLALVIAILALGGVGLLVLPFACLATLPLFWLAKARIGGQTGDILGGSQQIAEVAALATIAAWMA